LNGGYAALERTGLFGLPYVYADTALASRREMEDYLGRYGTARLFFGSDYPFGHPAHELAKVTGLNLPQDQEQAVLGGNFRRVCRLGKGEGVASDQ
jgi:predicted TIM-barrel fold metal-dependent hydrolase